VTSVYPSGKRAFPSAMKVKARAMLERWEVRMQAQVTAMRVRSPHAESTRFPWR
jgi:hypothetical protein